MNNIQSGEGTETHDKLLLWDVDATLLSTDGIGGEVMRAAMGKVFGAAAPRERTFYSGKTDRQIIHETFPDVTHDMLVRQLYAFSTVYIAEFQQRWDEFCARSYTLPGVRALLQYFHPRVLQAPLTGNIAPIARLKLEVLDLLPYLNLDVGAYGDDHHERTQLVPIASERAARLTGRTFQGADIVVIGDTPYDILCGRLNGARTVAVATGPYSLEELQAHQPDALLPNLSDFEAARTAIVGE